MQHKVEVCLLHQAQDLLVPGLPGEGLLRTDLQKTKKIAQVQQISTNTAKQCNSLNVHKFTKSAQPENYLVYSPKITILCKWYRLHTVQCTCMTQRLRLACTALYVSNQKISIAGEKIALLCSTFFASLPPRTSSWPPAPPPSPCWGCSCPGSFVVCDWQNVLLKTSSSRCQF